MKNDIISALTSFGYLDIERCNNVLDDAGVLDSDYAEYLHEMNDTGDKLLDNDIDLVGWAYDYVLSLVRQEIEQATGKDIFNDLEENVNVAGNYCATSYDWTDKAQKETLELALKVEEPSKALTWFINQIN